MKKKIISFIGLCFILILLISFSLYLYRQTTVKKVEIESNSQNIKGLGVLNGKNLIFLNEERLIQELNKQNPNLKKIIIQKKYPNTLLIFTVERIPIAQIKKNTLKINVDSDGVYLFEAGNVQNLPEIDADNIPLFENKKADWRISKSLELIENLYKNNINPRKIAVNNKDNQYSVYLNDGSEVIVPYETDNSAVAASLQIIISRFRIEGKFISKIDFRSDKPIVVLANEEKNSSTIK